MSSKSEVDIKNAEHLESDDLKRVVLHGKTASDAYVPFLVDDDGVLE